MARNDVPRTFPECTVLVRKKEFLSGRRIVCTTLVLARNDVLQTFCEPSFMSRNAFCECFLFCQNNVGRTLRKLSKITARECSLRGSRQNSINNKGPAKTDEMLHSLKIRALESNQSAHPVSFTKSFPVDDFLAGSDFDSAILEGEVLHLSHFNVAIKKKTEVA